MAVSCPGVDRMAALLRRILGLLIFNAANLAAIKGS